MSAGHDAMNDFLRRRGRPPQPDHEFAAEHENPDVPKLLKLRALSAEAGDLAGVGEMNRRLVAIEPTIEPLRIDGVDAGAGRGQRHEARDPDAHMNAVIRAGARYGRERLAELVDEELR
jgi:hypothetical protein